MRSLAFGKAVKPVALDKKPQALVFQSCRLWQEARDSGYQELQQLNFRPVPYSNSISTEPFRKAGKGNRLEPCF